MYVSRFVPKGIVAYCVKATTEVSRNSARNEIDTLITTVSFLVPFKFGKLTRNGIHSGADALTRPSEVVIVVSRHCTTPPAVERTKRTHLVRNGPLYKVKSPCALCRPLYPSISRLFNSQWDSGSRSVVVIILTVGLRFRSRCAASISLTGVLRGHHGHKQGHDGCRPTFDTGNRPYHAEVCRLQLRSNERTPSLDVRTTACRSDLCDTRYTP